MSLLMRDNLGNIVLPGRVTRTLTDPLMPGGALPSWQSAVVGTASFQSFLGSASLGTATVTSSGSINAPAAVKLTGNLTMLMPAQFQAMAITLDGLSCDADTGMDIEIGFQGVSSKGGCSMLHLNGATTAVLRTFSADGTVTTNYPTNYAFFQPSGGGRSRRNLTFLLLPYGYSGGDDVATGRPTVALLEDDQVVAAVDISATFVATSTVSPIWQVIAREAVAHSISWRQSTLMFNHN